jgi:ribonuclease BN (tRNA processing enzyme)
MPHVVFVGTGDAFDPDRPNTSVLYVGGATALLDCGFSAFHAFLATKTPPNALDAVWLSHTHGDHAFGLPALLLWMRVGGRTRPLRVMGGAGLEAWLWRVLDLAYPESFSPGKCFPIEVHEVTPNDVVQVGETEWTFASTLHGVPNLSARIKDSQHVTCYSGDGVPTAAHRALYHGADLLVHECQWLAGQASLHASLPDALAVAGAASVKRLALVHLSAAERPSIVRAAAEHPLGALALFPEPGQRLQV